MPAQRLHPRSALRIATGALAIALALGMAPASVAEAKSPPPPARLTSTVIDAHLGYMPQTTCSPSAKPGAKAVLKMLIKAWGGSSSGISRGCGVGTRSEHKEGRAFDWHMSVKKASQRKRVNAAMAWITANNGEVALRLGIMYMIWNQHIWSVYYPELGWRKMADRGSPTANHKDHVHISLSWDGAYQQTSWWTGTPITVPLNSRCGTGGARACLPVISRTTKKWPYQRTIVPASFTPAPWVRPGIGGSPQVGRLQTAVPGTWVPAGATLSYQWTSNGKAIPGATAATYLIPPSQVGREVEVRVTATSGSRTETRESNNTAPVYRARFATAKPRIVGVLAPGQTLRVDTGTWTPTPTRLTYRWLRDGKTISGASAATYTVGRKDLRHKISVKVTASRAGYYTTSLTSASARISAGFTSTAAPVIAGEPVAGGTLHAQVAAWVPAAAFSYQWYVGGKPIASATSSSIRLTSAMTGSTIQVAVIGRRSGYASVRLVSAASDPVG